MVTSSLLYLFMLAKVHGEVLVVSFSILQGRIGELSTFFLLPFVLCVRLDF